MKGHHDDDPSDEEADEARFGLPDVDSVENVVSPPKVDDDDDDGSEVGGAVDDDGGGGAPNDPGPPNPAGNSPPAVGGAVGSAIC